MVVEGLTARFAYVLSFAFSLMPWGYPYSLLFCIHPIGWVPALAVQFCYPAFIRLYQCHISDFSTESLAVLPKCPLRIVRPLLFFLFKSTSIHSETYNNVTYALARHASILSFNVFPLPFQITPTPPYPIRFFPRPRVRLAILSFKPLTCICSFSVS